MRGLFVGSALCPLSHPVGEARSVLQFVSLLSRSYSQPGLIAGRMFAFPHHFPVVLHIGVPFGVDDEYDRVAIQPQTFHQRRTIRVVTHRRQHAGTDRAGFTGDDARVIAKGLPSTRIPSADTLSWQEMNWVVQPLSSGQPSGLGSPQARPAMMVRISPPR